MSDRNKNENGMITYSKIRKKQILIVSDINSDPGAKSDGSGKEGLRPPPSEPSPSSSSDNLTKSENTSTNPCTKNLPHFLMSSFIFIIEIVISVILAMAFKKIIHQEKELNRTKMIFCKSNKNYDFCKKNIIKAKYLIKTIVQPTILINEIHPIENFYMQIDSKEKKYKNKIKYQFEIEGEHTVLFYFGEQQIVTVKEMFKNIVTLIEIDLSELWTGQIEDMREMFSGCVKLRNVNFLGVDTSKVVNMEGLFFETKSLVSLNLSSIDTKNVQKMGKMFWGMINLMNLDISGFDLRSVSKLENINGIFDGIKNSNEFCFVYNSSNNQEMIINLILDKIWIKKDLNKKEKNE